MTLLQHPMLQDRRRIWKTLVVFLAFASHGFGFGVVGSVMLDLQISTQSTLQQIGYMVPARAIGIAIGATICSSLIRGRDIQLVMAIALSLGAVLEIIIPYSPYWWLVSVLFVFNGVCFGIIENCCNVFVVRLWGQDCPAVLQVLYFFIGVGASISPLIVRPLLLDAEDEEDQKLFKPEDVKVHLAFLIIGIEILVAAVACFILYFVSPEKDICRTACHDETTEVKPETLRQKVLRSSSFVTAMTVMFLVCGLEVAFGAYIMPYALKADIHVDKKTGALMQSVYWLFFTCGRLITCFYINYVGPRNSTIISLIISLIGVACLTPASNTSVLCMWIGSVLYGIGLSPMWGNLFGFVQLNFPSHSAFLTSALITTACIGECVIPVIVSIFIVRDNMSFTYITCALTGMLFLSFLILCCFVTLYSRQTSLPDQEQQGDVKKRGETNQK